MNLINIEIKARCANPEIVRTVLRNQHARFAGLDHQVDTYFRVPSGRLKLRQGNIENALIAYQRPNEAGPKTSEVSFAKLTNGDELQAILKRSLGVLVAVDKQREIYYVENVKFHIDLVDGLGGFVEIEAAGQPAERDKLLEQCREYIRLFSIREEDLVEKSYSDLLLESTDSSQ
jgi:adenylate cyclase, class 2